MRESNRMLPFREGNHTCPQRHKYSEMVGTHHPVGARGIVAGRFWAVRGGETTPRYGCEHATAYSRMAPVPFSSSKLVLAFRPVCGAFRPPSAPSPTLPRVRYKWTDLRSLLVSREGFGGSSRKAASLHPPDLPAAQPSLPKTSSGVLRSISNIDHG